MISGVTLAALSLLSIGYSLGALSSPRAATLGCVVLCLVLWAGIGLLIFS